MVELSVGSSPSLANVDSSCKNTAQFAAQQLYQDGMVNLIPMPTCDPKGMQKVACSAGAKLTFDRSIELAQLEKAYCYFFSLSLRIHGGRSGVDTRCDATGL